MGGLFPLPEDVGDALHVHDARTEHGHDGVVGAFVGQGHGPGSAGTYGPALRACGERLHEFAH
jgi:hypothetical protein